MKTVTFNQVVELNKKMQEKELLFRVHIRDACGAQSFYVERLEKAESEGTYQEISTKDIEEMHKIIEDYLKSDSMNVIFIDDMNFAIQA